MIVQNPTIYFISYELSRDTSYPLIHGNTKTRLIKRKNTLSSNSCLRLINGIAIMELTIRWGTIYVCYDITSSFVLHKFKLFIVFYDTGLLLVHIETFNSKVIVWSASLVLFSCKAFVGRSPVRRNVVAIRTLYTYLSLHRNSSARLN